MLSSTRLSLPKLVGTARVARRSISSSLALRAPRLASSVAALPSLRSFSPAPFGVRMSSHGSGEDTVRPAADQVVQDIADYVHSYKIDSELAYATARLCLIDTIGCGLEGLKVSPACAALMAPVVPGTIVPNGAKVPGTNFQLDPVRAAFAIGTQIRWLDFNDCFLAAEWGHPSDNLGAIMAVADYVSRSNVAAGKAPLTVKDILEGMIMAHEIQGCIALENSFNRVGLDHVVLVKLASAAVVSKLLGLSRDQTVDVISQVFVDGQSLRTYRHAPNTGSRKSWAAGDACSRAVNLALLVQRGEMGIPTVLSVPTWGFYDVLFKGKPFEFQRPYGSYIMENVLFKISFPAEFHAQTAAEAALVLNGKLKAMGKTASDIKELKIRTQEAAIRIIDKKGPLDNYADRDHAISYMTAIPLIFGRLTSTDYLDDVAANPRIDELRAKTFCVEDKTFSAEYHDPEKRFIGNALTITLNDGTVLDEVHIDYPVGHKRRREEGIPLLNEKFERHIAPHFSPAHVKKILETVADQKSLEALDVPTFVDLFVVKD
ncbi:2-methylcitrate dehydratase, partial [Phenoliferia sp. Uapishka_3]